MIWNNVHNAHVIRPAYIGLVHAMYYDFNAYIVLHGPYVNWSTHHLGTIIIAN